MPMSYSQAFKKMRALLKAVGLDIKGFGAISDQCQ
jgi:hypothetical protein